MEQHHIIRLGHQGDGIAEGPLFAPLTLPDEIVTGIVDGKTLRDVKIVTPSEFRVKPPCPHFKSCGGCQLMHASDDFVARWKVDVVRAAMAAHGLSTQMRACLTSPARSRRRAAFSGRRTKKGATVGFHARGSDTIVEIPNCVLLTEERAVEEGFEPSIPVKVCTLSRGVVSATHPLHRTVLVNLR